MRVLYVDDDATMTAAVEQMFTSEDFQCDTSALGETAVDLAKQSNYDIILLDVMLPDIDGYEVIARLRTAGVRTPVLLQSGLVDRESDIDGLWLGATDYLLKPFNKRELFERIQAVLSRPADGRPQDPVHVSQSPTPSDEANGRRRRHRRFETVQPGRILHNGGIDCVILNMSHGGAALQLFDPDVDCPDSFELLLQSGATLRCRVRWRVADKIGIQGEAIFPDEVVTEILKQGEAEAPGAVAAGVADDGHVEPPASADGPAPSPGEDPPPDELRQAAPERPAAPVEEPVPEPKTAGPAADESRGAAPVQVAPEDAAPAAEFPATDHGRPHAPLPPGSGEDGAARDFTVDRGTHLVAEACEYDRLVVDGHLEAAARARRLQLGRDGRFLGSAVVEAAEISGHYEGDLTVADRLVIRAGGTVTGTTRYREIVIEAGGGLVGQAQLLRAAPQGTAGGETDARSALPARPVAAAHA